MTFIKVTSATDALTSDSFTNRSPDLHFKILKTLPWPLYSDFYHSNTLIISIDIHHLGFKLGSVPDGFKLFRHRMIDEEVLLVRHADVHLRRLGSHDLRIHRLLVQQHATAVRLGDEDGRTETHGLQLHGLTVDNVEGGHDVLEHDGNLHTEKIRNDFRSS